MDTEKFNPEEEKEKFRENFLKEEMKDLDEEIKKAPSQAYVDLIERAKASKKEQIERDIKLYKKYSPEQLQNALEAHQREIEGYKQLKKTPKEFSPAIIEALRQRGREDETINVPRDSDAFKEHIERHERDIRLIKAVTEGNL